MKRNTVDEIQAILAVMFITMSVVIVISQIGRHIEGNISAFDVLVFLFFMCIYASAVIDVYRWTKGIK